MPLWFASTNGELLNLDDIYPRGCTISFLEGNITEFAELQPGDDPFDPIMTCPFCHGAMCDEYCITCGAPPQFSAIFVCDTDEPSDDSSALWPLPEMKPEFNWDSHMLDCECPECSTQTASIIQHRDTSELIATQLVNDFDNANQYDAMVCEETLPPT